MKVKATGAVRAGVEVRKRRSGKNNETVDKKKKGELKVEEEADYADILRQHRLFLLIMLGFFIQTCALGARYLTETFAGHRLQPFTMTMLCVGFKLVIQLSIILFLKLTTPAEFFNRAMNCIDIMTGSGMLFGEYLARVILK